MGETMRRRAKQNDSGRTILVVDDQEEARVSTQALLEREGHRVLTASSAAQALGLLREREVDLLLVDYFMPGTTGEQLVGQVRTFDPFVQIILQTGYSGEKPPRAMLAHLDIQGYHDKAEGPEKLLLWVDVGLKAHRRLQHARAHDHEPGAAGAAASPKVVVASSRRDGLDDLAGLLIDGGYEPLTARTAGEALDIFVRERPFLLLVDDSVLDRSGADLIRRVRSIEPATAVIALSGVLETPQRRRLMRQLGLHAVHDTRESPRRILEMLDSAVEATRRVARTGADQALRGLVLAKLCHDLRSCLHVVHGYTELLSADPAAAPLQPMLGRLAAASESGRELVQQYLDLAHLDSPGVVVRRELVDLDDLLAELTVHAEHQIGTKALRLVVTAPVRGAVIHSDREKLTAILKQLLNNAITFSVAGSIELALSFAADQTLFVLTDTGPAMGRAEFASLAFVGQPEAGVQRAATPGHGLGLAIALRLSELLGGALRAERGAHGAAVFTLSLPAPALAAANDAPTLH